MLSNITFEGILLWWFVISTSSGVFASQLLWKRDKAFDDVLPKLRSVRGRSRWSSLLAAKSLLDCGQHCAQDSSCNTFFYNYVTRGCLPGRMLFEEPRAAKSAPGWRYYKLASDGAGYVSDRVSGVQYRLDRAPESLWGDGRVRCQNRGEDLAILQPAVKARFIHDYFVLNPGLNINRDVNIGAKFLNMDGMSPMNQSDFIWLNGCPMDFSGTNFWASGQPPLGQVIESTAVVIGSKSENFNWKIAPFLDKNGGRYALCERPFLN